MLLFKEHTYYIIICSNIPLCIFLSVGPNEINALHLVFMLLYKSPFTKQFLSLQPSSLDLSCFYMTAH